MSDAMKFETREDGIAVLTIDVPGASQNTLKPEFKEGFIEALSKARASGAKGLVITSGKETSFVAGADIEMIKTLTTKEEATAKAAELQGVFNEIEDSKIPVVAAIHGACLGGGLELALACHARVASVERQTKLGVPEVQLGLLPGAGGTQRLPREVGLEVALDMLLTGKQIGAKKAKRLGLVQEVVPRAIVVEAAARLAVKLADSRASKSFTDRVRELADFDNLKELALAKNPAGRAVVFSQAEKTLAKKAGTSYPAPYAILDCVRHGLEKGLKAGLEREAEKFGELVMTDVSKNLIAIFFASTALKKDNGTDKPKIEARPIQQVGVLGAGIMGHGIGYVTATRAGLPVRIRDREPEAVTHGLAEMHKLIDKALSRRRVDQRTAALQHARIAGTTGYEGFLSCDVVIEAVFEDLAVKHTVVREIEAVTRDDTIFASNTSSIPITKIAEASSRKGNMVGMHYFSPVHKMPLLEIIRTKDTTDEVVATVVALGKKQGKTVIVVNDGVGFYTSRILGPYMNEAAWMLTEGIPIEVIDRAAKQFGFPVGPITLLDEVGIDTAAKVSKIAREAFGDRMDTPGGLERLVADGRTGRKGKRGFYTYVDDQEKSVDASVYSILGVTPDPKKEIDLEQLGERLALPMVAEAIRCLEENIVRSPRDGDIGAIFGLGFPPFTGGPFRMADVKGTAAVAGRLDELAAQFGKRFASPELLLEKVRRAETFHK